MMTFKLVIPDEVFQKIMWWVNKSNYEVSGFGSLDFDQEKGIFTVRDAILLKQEVGSAMTEIDPASLGRAMYQMREEPNALKWHWHSHVDMAVFWSGDDKALIKELGQRGWIVASVFNKRREIKSAFYSTIQVMCMDVIKTQELFLEDIHTGIQRYIEPSLCEAWDKQYDENVKPRVFTPASSYGSLKTSVKLGFVKDADRYQNRQGVHREKYHECDEYGMRYSWRCNKWVYNPLYDKLLRTDKEIVQAILTMDNEEVESAESYWHDKENRFAKLYELAIELKIEQGEAESLLLLEGGLQ